MNHDPCKDCGLCCEHLLVEADAIDVLREPKIDKERPLGKLRVPLPILDASWLLAGPGMPCPFLSPQKRCEIYSSRPQVCVAFTAGSAKCQELRKAHGLELVKLQTSVHRVLTDIMKAAIAEEIEEPE